MKLLLIGDSTCQTYGPDMAPQQGWGGEIYRYFEGHESVRIEEITHEKPKAVRYVLPDITVENWGASARSSRTYIEEGRLAMVEKDMAEGDFVFIQFGHNDIKSDMPEKYVSADDYPGYLEQYYDAALRHGACPVFLSPIAKRNAEDYPDGHFHYDFSAYRDRMSEFCGKTGALFIDFGAETMKYCEKAGIGATRKIYLHVCPGDYPESMHVVGKSDNVHLNAEGAYVFAGILASLLRSCTDERIYPLSGLLV